MSFGDARDTFLHVGLQCWLGGFLGEVEKLEIWTCSCTSLQARRV